MPNYLKHKNAPKRAHYRQETLYKRDKWRKYRRAYILRQGGICEHCGDTPPDHMLHLDHITPLVDGGDAYDTNNLQLLCIVCHGKKTAKETWGRGSISNESAPDSPDDKARTV